MRTLYTCLTYVSIFVLKGISIFNNKIKLGIQGRQQSIHKLQTQIEAQDQVIWCHSASLGEYEQGLPVFEELKTLFPNHKLVLTFFSPSGYEIKKESPIADVVVYLPFDTKSNAIQFLNLIHPELVIFVKYEVWPNYLNELRERRINSLLISALLRKEQIYFKSYGGIMRNALTSFDHIFTQDESSEALLRGIDYSKVTVAGDTRFDRVYKQLEMDNQLDFVAKFKSDQLCIVAGSTWPEDEALFINYINNYLPENTKVIIAPHNIHNNSILKFKQALNKPSILYSNYSDEELSKANILILDTIGLLSKIYSYADLAYVGGAMGATGLHNTLEPATFGVPIVIGKHYEKFPEAKAMIQLKGMFTVAMQSEFDSIMSKLIEDKVFRMNSGKNNRTFVEDNIGAVDLIMDHIKNLDIKKA